MDCTLSSPSQRCTLGRLPAQRMLLGKTIREVGRVSDLPSEYAAPYTPLGRSVQNTLRQRGLNGSPLKSAWVPQPQAFGIRPSALSPPGVASMDLLCPPPLPMVSTPRKPGRPPATGLDRRVRKRPAAHMADCGSAGQDPEQPAPARLGPPTPLRAPGAWPNLVTFGSVCSGLGTEKWACPLTADRHTTLFTCDIDAHSTAFLKENNVGQYHFRDVATDEFRRGAPPVDVLIGGFPCQPFSAMGSGRGVADTRGVVILDIYRFITLKAPKIVILENVPGLLTHHGNTFLEVLELLKSVRSYDTPTEPAYSIYWKILDACEVGGVPQRRQRLWIVLIARSLIVTPFSSAPPSGRWSA